MSSSPLHVSTSSLAYSPQPLRKPPRAPDGEAIQITKEVRDHLQMHTQRKHRLGHRVYIALLTLTISYLVVRTWRSFFAVKQLSGHDATALSDSNTTSPQVVTVTIAESAGGGTQKPKKHRKEPNCRRQYWSKLASGRWIASPKESWIAAPGTACGEDDDPVSSPPRKPHCPDTSSILLVLLTSPTGASSTQLSSYLSNVPCVSPITSLAIYSTAPDEILVPYPHTDCESCNARVSVPIHDSLALAEMNTTLPSAVTRLHDAILQHQTYRFSTFPFESHKAFAELRKYRLLPALLHAYQTHAMQQWFVLATTEVHVSVRNIAAWTNSLKTRGPVYAGAQMMYEGQEFAPLDAGIILNREAVGRMVKYGSWEVLPMPDPKAVEKRQLGEPNPKEPRYDGVTDQDQVGPAMMKPQEKRELPQPWRPKETYLLKWYADLAASPHADVAFAFALHDIGVNLTRSHPLMRTNSMLDIEWGRDSWCKAALTWGKVDEAQHEMLAKGERKVAREARQRRKPKTPNGGSQISHRNASSHHHRAPKGLGTFGSLFRHTLLPKLIASPSLSSWDNGAADLEFYEGKKDYHHAAKSFNSARACMGACGLAPDCLQWKWEPGRCRLGHTLKMGKPSLDADDKVRHEWNGLRQGIVSGWMGHRISEMADSWDEGCWNSTGF